MPGADPEPEQEIPLGFGLDAFGDHLQPEAARHPGHGFADRHVGLVARNATDEDLAQLDAVDGQASQVVERAVAFTEIVDRQAHAEFAQFVENPAGITRVLDQHPFGEFQFERMAGDAGVLEHVAHAGDDVFADELAIGHIDRDALDRQALITPSPHPHAGLVQGPVADPDHLAGAFRKIDEALRRDFAQLRVMPTDQGFRKQDATAAQVHLRLVGEMELAVVQCASQAGFDLQSCLLCLLQRGRECLHAAVALAFARIHGDIGALDQAFRGPAVGGGVGHADTRADAELLPAQHEWSNEGVLDLSCQPLRTLEIVLAATGNQEFIATKTGDHAFRLHRRAQAMGDIDQQLVAGIVTEHIVDDLEAIKVDVKHGKVVSATSLQATADVFEDRVAVEQPGQGIGARLLTQGLLGVLAFGDVLQGAGQVDAAWIEGVGLADHAHPERRTAGGVAAQVQIEPGVALDRPEGLAQERAISGVQTVEQGGHACRSIMPAQDAHRFAGQVQRIAMAIPLPATDLGEFLHAFEQGFVALQRGDVAADHQCAIRCAGAGVVLRHRGDREPIHALAGVLVQADDGVIGGFSLQQGAGQGIVGDRQHPTTGVDHRPVFESHLRPATCIQRQAIDACRRRVEIQHPAIAIMQGDRHVDDVGQRHQPGFGADAGTQIAGNREDGVTGGADQPCRVHLHREPGAIATHIDGLHDMGFTAVNRLEHGIEVARWQIRIEEVDAMADQVFARAAEGFQSGGVGVEDDAFARDDQGWIGNGIDEGAMIDGIERVLMGRALEHGGGLAQQGAQWLRLGAVCGCRRQRGGQFGRIGSALDGSLAGTHRLPNALPTRLLVSRPSRLASQRPVSASAPRSTPVRTPSPSSMYTTSSLATLPLAPLA